MMRQEFVEEKRVIKFLYGLNGNLEEVQGSNEYASSTKIKECFCKDLQGRE